MLDKIQNRFYSFCMCKITVEIFNLVQQVKSCSTWSNIEKLVDKCITDKLEYQDLRNIYAGFSFSIGCNFAAILKQRGVSFNP